MDDPDIPDSVKEKFGDTFDHWILFNLDPSVTSIDENSTLGVQGSNSGGEAKYTGPCPPDREHRYFFKLYALDITLDLEEGAAKKEVEAAMEGHIIEKAELMGRYERLENG